MIRCENVSFSYPSSQTADGFSQPRDALKNISCTIEDGSFVLLCGTSGCGKTTLTRLFNGLIPHYYEGSLTGQTLLDGTTYQDLTLFDISKKVGSVFQNPRSQFFNVDTTGEIAFGCENHGMPEPEIVRRVEHVSKQLDLIALLGRSIFCLSGGERQKIACGSVAAMEPEVYVLDEPSSNLDACTIADLRELLKVLKAQDKTIVVAEHRLHYLYDLADRVIYLQNGEITGDYTAAEFRAIPESERNQMGLRPLTLAGLSNTGCVGERSSDDAWVIREFHFSYKGSREETLCIDNAALPSGGVTAVIGHNGAGKTTLSRCLCGLEKQCGGTLGRAEEEYGRRRRLKLCYLVMQDVNHQLFTESVLEEVLLSMREDDHVRAEAILEEMDLLPYKDYHPMGLSGGQKQRVAIASALASGRPLVLFDEPTSGLDLFHMRQVADSISRLADSGKTVMVVTHDPEFILRCCDQVIHMEQGRIVGSYSLKTLKDRERLLNFFFELYEHKEGVRMMKEKKSKKESSLSIMWSWGKPYHGKFALSIILAILGVACQMVPYFCVANIVIGMFAGDRSLAFYLTMCGVALAGYFGKVLFSNLSTALSHTAAYCTLRDLRERIVGKLSKVPMGNLLNTPSGQYKTTIVDRIEGMEIPFAHLLPEMTSNVLVPLFIVAYLFILDWRMALLSLVTLVIGLVVMTFGMRDYSVRWEGAVAAGRNLANAVVEYIGGIEVVKAFSQSAGSYRKYADAVHHKADYYITWMAESQKTMCSYNAIIPSVLIGILPAGLALWLSGSLEISTFMTVVIFSLGLVGPIMASFTFMSDVAILAANVEEIDGLLNAEELIHGTKPVILDRSGISLNDVSFSYGGTQEVLHKVSFSIQPKTMTALVGPSGSGKSTIAKLIAGYWDVTCGSLVLGGHELKDIPLSQVADQISYVSQDNYLFNRTIRENIRMGKPDATDEEVEQVARQSGCDAFIRQLEAGYETAVGSGGSHLSGGERQRIAIARAMLKNAPIVILDEATAYIDPENETLVQKAISALATGKTLIVIAHRLSTIIGADTIVVVNQGSIEAQGTHDELLAGCPLYRDMWQAHIGAKDQE